MRPVCLRRIWRPCTLADGEGIHVIECFAGCDYIVWVFLACFETHVFANYKRSAELVRKSRFPCFDVPPERLAKAVADGDATALAKAPGLGKKVRRRYSRTQGSIDLSQIEGASKEVRSAEDAGSEQVVEGLMSLGWRQQDALHAVQTVCESNHINVPLRDDDVPACSNLHWLLLTEVGETHHHDERRRIRTVEYRCQ